MYLDLAAIFASMRISIILFRCFHLRTFITSVHIILGPVIFRDRGKVAEFAELPT